VHGPYPQDIVIMGLAPTQEVVVRVLHPTLPSAMGRNRTSLV